MNAGTVAVIVLAKAPAPGRVKTRLCPPCTPAEAALLAEAALRDTLATVAAAGVHRRVLALDGAPGSWVPGGFTVVPQRGEGLDARLAAAFSDTGGPAVLVGMDTPQLTPVLLRRAIASLAAGRGAVLGPALDGGYWTVGLARPDPRVFHGVPMSTSSTARAQLARLTHLGLDVELLPRLCDVDTYDDAVAVAAVAPSSRFARALASLELDAAVA